MRFFFHIVDKYGLCPDGIGCDHASDDAAVLHAQRIAEPPFAVLRAVPGADVRPTADSAQCCGSAGLYSTLEPELSRTVLAPKVERILADPPDILATANPGCVMQLGAGLRAAGDAIPVRHPVELLDQSYRAAGRYA